MRTPLFGGEAADGGAAGGAFFGAEVQIGAAAEYGICRNFVNLFGNVPPSHRKPRRIPPHQKEKTMWKFFEKLCHARYDAEPVAETESQAGEVLYDRIWSSLEAKGICNERECPEGLSHGERLFYVTRVVEDELRECGFFALCYNRYDHLLEPAVRYFRELGAVRRADIIERALAVLERIEPPCCEHATQRDEAQIDALQAEYFALEENYEAMLLNYVKTHRDEFPA